MHTLRHCATKAQIECLPQHAHLRVLPKANNNYSISSSKIHKDKGKSKRKMKTMPGAWKEWQRLKWSPLLLAAATTAAGGLSAAARIYARLHRATAARNSRKIKAKKKTKNRKQSENIFDGYKNFRCRTLLHCDFPHIHTANYTQPPTHSTRVQQVVLGSLWHAAWSNAF